jgi:murein tripeptide amidase MpaA
MPRLPLAPLVAAALALAACGVSAAGHAQPAPVSDTEAARRALLPPELPWRGKSLALVASPLDPWITPAEASGFERTPSYDDTVAWLKQIVAAAPELQLVSLGTSPEGREILMVVASKERARTPQALAANGKPTLFAQAGIHAGEIDGKDAGLMLLRDLSVRGTRRALLERANLLFVPILSVDAHERSSPYSRINQRGPSPSGWRTNARNQNLNRDYGKLDTPEMRAVVRALGEWNPDLYFDLHVTDGMDYQYDVTFGWNGAHGHSPAIAAWLEATLGPALRRDLEAMGHVPGPLIQPIDNDDPSKGLADWTADTKFSNGYGDARHLATVLFENHSLKPYRQRVLGLYVALESALRALGVEGAGLRAATARDRARRPSEITLAWKTPQQPDASLTIRGVRYRREASPVSGAERIVWTGEPETQTLPLLRMNRPAVTTTLPAAYWVPPAWGEVIERLALHGVQMEKQSEAREVEVEMYRVGEFTLEAPFEGHTPVKAAPSVERRRERFPPGSVRIPADQPLFELAALLLEPASPDSYFRWGFFLETLQATEYVEAYVMEPMARAMLAADPALKAEFERRLAGDKAFAADPRARLQWLYERTPFFDARHRLYPVGREIAAPRP